MTELAAITTVGYVPPFAVSFTVLGQAQTAGSKRAFKSKTGRVLVVDDNPRSQPWKQEVAAAGHQAMNGNGLLTGALGVHITFWQPRPAGHYGTGRNSGLLRASAPRYPTTRPDVLKLARAIEDALTGICWRDDAQIVSETISKYYGEPARAEILIREAT